MMVQFGLLFTLEILELCVSVIDNFEDFQEAVEGLCGCIESMQCLRLRTNPFLMATV